MKLVSGIQVLCLYLAVFIDNSVAPDCTPLTGRFDKHDEVQLCTGQGGPADQWLTVCTVDWEISNPSNVCSRLTNTPSTVTTTKTEIKSATKTVLRCTTNITETIRVTSTEKIQLQVCRSTASSDISQQSIQPTTTHGIKVTSATLRPSPTAQIRTKSQAPHTTVQTEITATPIVEKKDQSDPLLLSCNITTTALAIVSGTLLVCLVLSLIGWMWTCCMLRSRTKGSAATPQNQPKRLKTDEHKFENPIYEDNIISADTNHHNTQGPGYENLTGPGYENIQGPGTQNTQGTEYETISRAAQHVNGQGPLQTNVQGPGYEYIDVDHKNPAGAQERRFEIQQPTAEGGHYYHVLEEPLPDHQGDTDDETADSVFESAEAGGNVNGATAVSS